MSVYNTQSEQKVFEAIELSVRHMGYEIVRIKNFQHSKNKILQIMIERIDGKPISVDDCATVSNQVSVLLDVADIVTSDYNLEISSPGLNKPLTRKKDFKESVGKVAKFILYRSTEGMRKFTGIIQKFEEDELEVLVKGSNKVILFKLDNIEEAFLQYFDSNINSNPK